MGSCKRRVCYSMWAPTPLRSLILFRLISPRRSSRLSILLVNSIRILRPDRGGKGKREISVRILILPKMSGKHMKPSLPILHRLCDSLKGKTTLGLTVSVSSVALTVNPKSRQSVQLRSSFWFDKRSLRSFLECYLCRV